MKTRFLMLVAAVVGLFYMGCDSQNMGLQFGKGTDMNISREFFGKTPDGTSVDLYTLSNGNGMTVKITNYGGIITHLMVPDRNGKIDDVVLGFDTMEEYLAGHPYFGAIAGRYANRIAKGRFTLDGVEYTLVVNNGENHLHGGIVGFDKVVWTAVPGRPRSDSVHLTLNYLSRNMEEGYPGNLDCTVVYELTADNELKITYKAATDKATVLNLTNHSYFNLAGQASGDILGHVLTLNANYYTPVDEGLIPTGELESVKGTVFDFTSPHTIGERLKDVPMTGGYDHNFCLNSRDGSMAWCATVYEPETGRVLEIETTQPGVQFYTGNFLDGSNKGKGTTYNKHNGFCLETQHWPDSPNKPHFPSVVLKPGQAYEEVTVFKFSTK
ncbi:MAG: galactose mutarotase [Sedimentisphaerales bacterium]|nr:galactose mutarotase [Sedimentisphaerales bacterium]